MWQEVLTFLVKHLLLRPNNLLYQWLNSDRSKLQLYLGLLHSLQLLLDHKVAEYLLRLQQARPNNQQGRSSHQV